MRLYKLLILLFFALPAHSQTLELAYGRLSLVDLGALIKSPCTIVKPELARVYELSGLENEKDKSIIAIQALEKSGETDLSLSTSAGIIQLHLIITNEAKDLLLNPKNARSIIHPELIKMSPERLTLLSSYNKVNEYVLASNPELISAKEAQQEKNLDYYKNFYLISNSKTGITDIVVATASAVHKFTIEIGGTNEHHEHIRL